jgi:hypothetical protein
MKRLIGIAVALLALVSNASAHSASTAYLHVESAGAATALQLRIALRDLDALLDLDADADGRLTWGEVSDRARAIEQLVQTGIVLQADDRPCALATQPPQFVRLDELGYAQIDAQAPCGAARLTYRIFAGIDPSHRVLLTRAGAASPAALAPGASMALAQADAPLDGSAALLADGAAHILGGLDHVLFLVGLLLPAVLERRAGRWVARTDLRRALLAIVWIATAFTVAHSLTLGLASFGIVRIPPSVIEPLIAATVLAAALNNIFPLVTRGLAWVAFAFGLIHGFGFAEVLVPLQLPALELARALLAFNLGVEAGQLAIIALLFAALAALRHWPAYPRWVLQGGSAALALIACGWIVERVFDVPVFAAVAAAAGG